MNSALNVVGKKSYRFCRVAICIAIYTVATVANITPAYAQVLDKQRLLAEQSFWDNRDFSWYAAMIPIFECPDPGLTTTYYYRWELLTKHLTYGSPNSGYSFTEFIDRPFWSGTYGAISCPAGHQLYESRWLRTPEISRDYSRYWFHVRGAEPRRYSTWLADAIWANQLVHPDQSFVVGLLPDLKKNFAGWESRHHVAKVGDTDVGLFWQVGHDDGMEFNIQSRQTKDILRGAPSFRPSFNAYMWADAMAISRIAELAKDDEVKREYAEKAASIKLHLERLLWDPKREFFFPMFRDNEENDGVQVKALTLTHQTGKFAGSEHGRELIGYVPWQFNMLESNKGYEKAWKYLMDPEYFYAKYGPSTVERNDPMFLLQKTCCWWSGQSWPYATTQTLKAMANVLQGTKQNVVSKNDYVRLLKIFSDSHRKEGRPYLAEACHPDTGSFEGHDGYNHSEHYFHSGFCDLVITGLVGLVPRDDNIVQVQPLAPDDWDYFAIDDIVYHGRSLSVLWDRTGERYGKGKGLTLLADGVVFANSPTLSRLEAALPPQRPSTVNRKTSAEAKGMKTVNFAVNNEGDYFPRITASFSAENSSPQKLIDGNYWYHRHPPNRWTTLGSNEQDHWIEIDLGEVRPLHMMKFYFLDDGTDLLAPRAYDIEFRRSREWHRLDEYQRSPEKAIGHQANVVQFREVEVEKVRIRLTAQNGKAMGLTEIECWGDAKLPISPPSSPVGNIAFRASGSDYPKASASHTSRFDKVEMVNDGKIVFGPTPHNRWTSYESPSERDWLEIDFGAAKEFRRVVLHVYDDRGGVQAPKEYSIEYWDGVEWRIVPNVKKMPQQPLGGATNTATFNPITATKMRVIFVHNGRARSGLTELEVWNDVLR